MRILLPLVLSSGCGGSWANIGGHINGTDFDHPRTAYHGGDFILFTKDKVECRDLDWLDQTFYDGVAPSTRDFTAVVLHSRDGYSADVPQIAVGFSGVRVWGLVNDGAFEAHHGREGQVTIESADDDSVIGTVSVSFGNGGIGGEFQTEFCQTLVNKS